MERLQGEHRDNHHRRDACVFCAPDYATQNKRQICGREPAPPIVLVQAVNEPDLRAFLDTTGRPQLNHLKQLKSP